jgi:hypothetical protein
MKLRYVAPLLAAAAAASIAAAPVALADTSATQEDCTFINGALNTQCATPGNTQINDSLPPLTYARYPFWYGDEGDRGFHGGHR